MEKQTASKNFIHEKFQEYYKKESSLIKGPSEVEKREFGFLLFTKEMFRHKGFRNVGELQGFLYRLVPLNVYYSCAYYENPEAEMERKGWLGADLVFDIDADHIPTPCDKNHDEWTCSNCGFVGKGVPPEKCPICGGEKFNVKSWPCEICLKSAKEETIKLIEMLTQDFGFSSKDLHVFFSGHRGYHVQVESESVKTLDATARKEIVDYVIGLGLDMSLHGLKRKSWRETGFSTGSHISDLGWYRRLIAGMQNFILNAEAEDFEKIGIRKKAVNTLLENRDKILKSLSENRIWGAVKGIGFETWRKIAEESVKLRSARVDTVVTTDTHRLIRMADTLHGKTGFKKIEFPVSAIDSFDPFKSAVAFKKGTATVFVYDAPKFRIGDDIFGPYKKQKVKLPTAAALLLICKNRAEIVE